MSFAEKKKKKRSVFISFIALDSIYFKSKKYSRIHLRMDRIFVHSDSISIMVVIKFENVSLFCNCSSYSDCSTSMKETCDIVLTEMLVIIATTLVGDIVLIAKCL